MLSLSIPSSPLALIVRARSAFGGVAAWEGEGSPHGANDEAVTHSVVDRPAQGHRFLARHYVQPQWVFDSANARVLMPAGLYEPGRAPPPHLSPFVRDEEEGYVPDFAATVARLQAAAKAARLRAAGALPEGFADGDADDAEAAALEAAEPGADDPEMAERVYQADLARELRAAADAAASEEEEGGSDGEGAAAGSREAALRSAAAGRRAAAAAAAAAEADAMKDIMMTRKNRKLYERINRAVDGKRERVEALEAKKRALGGAGAGEEPPRKKGK
jgi:pescadillo protein